MEHVHGEPEGPPFDFSKPITCPACKTELAEALRVAYAKGCKRYGTTYDERKIADLLERYN